MENVHHAIAWYQTKIGSYDKQLWEQSVERKLQKQPPFVLHNAPRKKVRLKTEYIDVDLIRGSTFTKTKPQVPWVYITRKAVARVLFFPFYYNWWVHQTSKRLYALLLVLYILQVATVIVYLRNFDHGIIADELSFTEVTLPTILMFLLCLIHSQTVLAHITHKPPKRNKNISGVTRKPRPKKASRKGRSSGNNSTCPEDGGNTDTSKSCRRQMSSQSVTDAKFESYPLNAGPDGTSKINQEPLVPSLIDMEKNFLSRSVSDYDLKPALSSSQSELLNSVRSSLQHHNKFMRNNDTHVPSNWQQKTETSHTKQKDYPENDKGIIYSANNELRVQMDDPANIHNSKCSLLDNFINPLTAAQNDDDSQEFAKRITRGRYCKCYPGVKLRHAHFMPEETFRTCEIAVNQKLLSENISKTVESGINYDCVDDHVRISENLKCKESISSNVSQTGIEGGAFSCGDLAVTRKLPETETNEDMDLGLFLHGRRKSFAECSDTSRDVQDAYIAKSAQHQHHGVCEPSFEFPSGSDNISMSDFEMIDYLVTHEKMSSLGRGTFPADLETCSFAQAWKNHLEVNSAEAKAGRCETHHVSGSIHRCKPRPLNSQDSSDSGINNEVPYVDCSCLNLHKDSNCDCAPRNKWQTTSTSGVEDTDDASLTFEGTCNQAGCGRENKLTKLSVCDDIPLPLEHVAQGSSNSLISDLCDPVTVKDKHLPQDSIHSSCQHNEVDDDDDLQSKYTDVRVSQSQSQISCNHLILQNENPASAMRNGCRTSISPNHTPPVSESSSRLHCFSEQFVQEILNEDTLREMSCSSLLAHSDLENSSSSVGHLSTASTTSSGSYSSSCCKICSKHHIPPSTKPSLARSHELFEHHRHPHHPHHNHNSLRKQENISHQLLSHESIKIDDDIDDEKNDPLDESLEHIHASDGERPSDDVSNYNPSDSDADSDGPVNEDICQRYEENWKRLRFQDHGGSDNSGLSTSKASTNIACGTTATKSVSGSSLNGVGSRSVVGILTRKPSPLKDLAIGRKPNSIVPVTNSSGSDPDVNEARNQLRRRRRTSGTTSEPIESNRRNVPTTLGLHPSGAKHSHISSSENETGGAHTPEGSNKATMSSEEWEDRMQSDETTSSAYSSNSEIDSEEREDGEEKTEYTTSTLHVINLLQPGVQPSCVPQSVQQSGSPSSSGNITQPDRVSCVIWEGNECKKVDLTALDIGWAIIDKVDSLPESSDYFLIGLSFSFIICVMPLVFRAYVSKDAASLEDFLSWSGLMTKLIELLALIRNSYSWRQYLLLVNGILQRFFLSLIFFFLLSVADRTFKQRLLYAKHFSYLTSSRRARKFSMPHFRLNKVRNIKIWLSLRSYLKRRGPQRSVDVIVSACFLCAVCTVCLISLQMLKDTDSYLDYLCNWELLVWCTALAVFLMRFMTVGLKINKKYRNLSVLITEQINLYLQMEQKPHKKEELILANNVLRLAEDLLKELESPFKISGFSANPLIYNIMRVVVLSAFSAVLTEVLGFKLKLHKIKLKA